MKQQQSKWLAGIALLAANLYLLPTVWANDAIGFRSPTVSRIVAGEPGSYMEVYWDWGLNTVTGTDRPCVNPTSPMDPSDCSDPDQTAVPNVTRTAVIETWRDAGSLMLRFRIDDQTRNRDTNDDGIDEPLAIGDKIIIQVDPNNTGSDSTPDPGDELEKGSGISQDYRFEISININDPDTAEQLQILGFEPSANPTINNWGNLPVATTATAEICNGATTPYECLEIDIPLSEIGGPSGDIGIAIALINDIGYSTPGTIPEEPKVVGTAFPSSMGMDFDSDPGVVEESQFSTGNWIVPDEWGLGYFNTGPGDVTLSHSPSFVWSDSIRISTCEVTQWDDVEEPPEWGDQYNTPGWYRYFASNPCEGKVWVKAFPTSSGVKRRRLFIVWGRPGIGGSQDWFPVAVTPPISFTGTDEEVVEIDNWVPSGENFTSHPCLRVYVLPDELSTGFEEAQLMAIADHDQLEAMEEEYEVYPYDAQTAQMNFTATNTGSCPTGSACVVANRGDSDSSTLVAESAAPIAKSSALEPDLTSEQHLPFLLASTSAEGQNVWPFAVNQSLAFMQTNNPGGGVVAPVQDPVGGGGGGGVFCRKDGRFKIETTAFGLSTEHTGTKYQFLVPIGGIGWVVPCDIINPSSGLELPFLLSNPRLVTRNFSGPTPTEIVSPTRQIVVFTELDASPGQARPRVVVSAPRGPLEPGEIGEATVTLKYPATSRWSLSFHAGFNGPLGSFDNGRNSGASYALDLEYAINRTYALELFLGRDEFGGANPVDVTHFSINGKAYFLNGPTRPFIAAGIGYYDADNIGSGTSGDGMGFNVGGGVQYNFNNRWAFEGTAKYHAADTSTPDVRFYTVLAGLRWRF